MLFSKITISQNIECAVGRRKYAVLENSVPKPLKHNIRLYLLAALIPIFSQTAAAGTFIINNEHNVNTGKIVIDGKEYGGSSSSSDDLVKGSGKAARETRKVSGFDSIETHGGVDVAYRQSDSYSLEISADDNILPLITTEVSGDKLVVSTKKSYSSSTQVAIAVTAPQLTAISIDGSGDVDLKSINGNSLTVDLNGTGDVTASGKVSDLHVKISGAGNVDSQELQAKNVAAQITGSGDLKVTAHDKLQANIIGTGDITYYGNPKVVDKNVIGVGDISSGD